MMAFSTQDVAAKMVTREVSLWQLQAVRSLATLVPLLPLVAGGAGVFVAWHERRPPRPQVHPRGEDPWTPDT
jgi:hypothetical protein